MPLIQFIGTAVTPQFAGMTPNSWAINSYRCYCVTRSLATSPVIAPLTLVV